jgi:hypothetical protein
MRFTISTPEDVVKRNSRGPLPLVDVRRAERGCGRSYPDAVVVPLSFDPQDIPDPDGKQVVFACRPGKDR